ncbi:MAG TPA: hypothetical protein VN033_09645 [Vulgatibacter sp.]|nr:hypothetical protein [Vulgatibacter sp.]
MSRAPSIARVGAALGGWRSLAFVAAAIAVVPLGASGIDDPATAQLGGADDAAPPSGARADASAATSAPRAEGAAAEARDAAGGGLPEATPLGFSARAEPSRVELGRPFVYEIEIRHDPADTYALPRPLVLGEAAVRKVETSREEAEGATVSRFRIEAALYDRLGEAALPDLVLSVEGAAGPRELRIPGAPVTVIATTEGDELAGMHPPQELRVPSYRVAWIAAGLLAAAFLGLLAHRRWRAWRDRIAAAPAPPRPPEAVALEALAALQAEGLPGAGHAREHYFRLSAIVRAFVEGSGGPEALERTSGELLAALRERPLAGLDLSAFASWLERGDVVRYAGQAIDPGVAAADLEEARAMVRAVARARAAVPASPAGGAPGGSGGTSASPAGGAPAGSVGTPASPRKPLPAEIVDADGDRAAAGEER